MGKLHTTETPVYMPLPTQTVETVDVEGLNSVNVFSLQTAISVNALPVLKNLVSQRFLI